LFLPARVLVLDRAYIGTILYFLEFIDGGFIARYLNKCTPKTDRGDRERGTIRRPAIRNNDKTPF